MDVVVYNMVGCEINRQHAETREELLEIMSSLVDTLCAGDTIKLEESDFEE